MRIPRTLQAFMPLRVAARMFDRSRPTSERTGYGILMFVYVIALTYGVLYATGHYTGIADVLHDAVLWFYALIQLILLVVITVRFIRQGIPLYSTNRFKAIGYCALGGSCGIVALLLTGMFVLVIMGNY